VLAQRHLTEPRDRRVLARVALELLFDAAVRRYLPEHAPNLRRRETGAILAAPRTGLSRARIECHLSRLQEPIGAEKTGLSSHSSEYTRES
jgi:hypothetical protein